MVAGVALGVALVMAIDLANDAARRGFLHSTQAVVGQATHRVLGGPGGLDQDVFRRVRVEAGLRRSAPVVEGTALALDLDRQALRVLGIDPLSEAPFRSHLGRLPGGASSASALPDLAPFMADPQAAVIGAALARRHGLTLGSPLRLRVDGREVTLRVAGLVDTVDPEARRALDGLVLMDVGTAQAVLRLPGRLSHVDLVATAAELERVARVLPAGTRLAAASEQAQSAAQMTAAFQLNLTALSLLALVVGMFLIYNTVTFGVVQRRSVFGTLRVLGATPSQILMLVLVEAACTSALGALLGLGAGYALGQVVVQLVTQTINDLYFVLSVRAAALTSAAAVKGLALGIVAGVLAALLPACEAAGVEPVEALRRGAHERRARARVPRVGLAGAAVTLVGVLVLLVSARALVFSFAGLFAAVLGLALLAPLATAGLLALATPLLGALAGTRGRLAARTVGRALGRTGVAVAALMVAVSVSIGVTLMIQSFRATVVDWLALTLRADVYVGVPGVGAGAGGSLRPEVLARVLAVPGVASFESLRLVQVASPLGDLRLAVTDANHARSARLYRTTEGRPEETWSRVLAGAVLASEPFARRHRLPARGATVTIQTERGPRTLAVAGVYYDYASERGTLLMHRRTYETLFADRARTSLAIDAVPGSDLDALADRLRAALRDEGAQVTVNAALRRAALRVFDRTFAVTQALRALAVVVAFIGVWSALMALQVERTRELATLQALGLTPPQLWSLTLLETGLMGLAAGLLSWPTGTLLAVLLVEVINVRSFGWSMTLRLDPWVYVQALSVALSAALLAAVYPLLRLQRIPAAAALRQE
jgi:putative ABC transport system permease protein